MAAVLTTVILGVGLQTQNVLAQLEGVGADIGVSDRLSMTVYDIQYLGSRYVIFVGIAFALAFLAAGIVFHFAKFGRRLIFSVAGAVGILVMLFAMKEAFFDIHMIAGARDGIGISMQMLAGAIGGVVFSKVSPPDAKTI